MATVVELKPAQRPTRTPARPLTMAQIKDAQTAAELRGQRVTLRDGKVAGLLLILHPTGRSSWRFEHRPAGRDPVTGKRPSSRYVGIGDLQSHNVAHARSSAAKLKTQAIAGRDPAAERRQARVEQTAATTTLADVFEIYERTRLTELRAGKDAAGAIRQVFKQLLKMPIKDVSRVDIARCVAHCADRGAKVRANRSLAYFKPLMRWALEYGYIETDPARDVRKPTKEKARDRVLSVGEVRAILRAADADTFPFRHIVNVLAFTAVRRAEAAGMRVEEIDLDEGVWRMPASRSKAGVAVNVPLSVPALAAIADAMHVNPIERGVLLSLDPSSPFDGFSKAKRRLDERCGIHDWRLHDLRTAFATAAADSGVAIEVVDKALNHVAASTMSAVRRAYMRSDLFEQRRAALELWADQLVGA